jgi:glutamate dehydrogenase
MRPAGASRTSPACITRSARPSASTACARAAGSFVGGDAFERLAVRRLIEDMLTEQTSITQSVLKFAANAQAGDDESRRQGGHHLLGRPARRSRPSAVKRTIEDIEQAGGGWTFAKLTIANAALRELWRAAA